MLTARRGRDAETLACQYLEARGLALIERNYHCRGGEIDLVMDHAGTLVFVEVRYRRRDRFGTGAESVDHRKQERIATSARAYLQARPGMATRPCRFDVVSIGGTCATPNIDWIQDAFSTML